MSGTESVDLVGDEAVSNIALAAVLAALTAAFAYVSIPLPGLPAPLGSGLGYLLGPTGGYLIGFLLAAVLIGAIVHRGLDPKPLSEVPMTVQAGALVAGLVLIYAVGVPWLVAVAGLPPVKAATVGALIFLPGDAIKIAATLALVKGGVLARQQSTATA